MDENKIMTNEETYEEPAVAEEGSGIGTGLAMLIGSGLTLAAIAGVKKLRKVWKNRKAKKEQFDANDGSKVIDITDEVEEVDEDE